MDVNYILKSKIRFEVLILLKNGSKTPTELSKNSSFYITHISSTLKELENKGLVTCNDPSVRKYKHFEITDKGKKLLTKINELTA